VIVLSKEIWIYIGSFKDHEIMIMEILSLIYIFLTYNFI